MAVAVIVMLGLLSVLQHVLRWNATLNARDNEHAALEALVNRWEAEADSSWAIFTPTRDVRGADNTDRHELDFFMRDGRGRDSFWAYTYDKTSHSLQRYLYAQPGAVPQADGAAIGEVRSFAATTYPITALQDPASPIYQPLYGGGPLRPAAVHFGYGPDVAGGNAITQVRIVGTTYARLLELSTQTAPSGFTIVYRYTPAPTALPTSDPPCLNGASPDPSTGACPAPTPSFMEVTTEVDYLSVCDGYPGPPPLPKRSITQTVVGSITAALGPPSRSTSYDGPYSFSQLEAMNPSTPAIWSDTLIMTIIKGKC